MRVIDNYDKRELDVTFDFPLVELRTAADHVIKLLRVEFGERIKSNRYSVIKSV